MATPIAVSNLERFALPEIEISYDSNGIISVIDDLVERVMTRHYRARKLALIREEKEFSKRELVA